MHNAYYTAPTNTFPEKEYRELAEALNTALRMPQIIDQALQMQKCGTDGQKRGLSLYCGIGMQTI